MCDAAEVGDLHHVLVAQARAELGLGDQHLGELRVGREQGQHALDHGEALLAERAERLGEEDLRHAALADLVEEQELAEPLR